MNADEGSERRSHPDLEPEKWEGPPLGSAAETDQWLLDLTSPDPAERADAAFVLGGSRRRRRRVIGALRSALSDEDPVVVNFAAQSLGQLGDLESLPTILRLLSTGPPRDRTGAAWAAAALAVHANEQGQASARAALRAYRSRARGFSRGHAEALIARLQGGSSEPRPG